MLAANIGERDLTPKGGRLFVSLRYQQTRETVDAVQTTEGKAKVVKRSPFTIQLLYGSSGYKQPVNVGLDTGASHVGIAAIRTDRPANLITLCEDCHRKIHSGEIKLTATPGRTDLRYAAQTQAGKTALLVSLQERLPTSETTGAVTKVDRLEMGLSKTHANDALAIAASGIPVKPLGTHWFMRCVPKGNYRLFKGAHSHIPNQSERELFGLRRWDKVRLPDGQEGFIKGKRSSGYFAVSTLEGNVINPSISYKRLRLLQKQTSLLIERRVAVSSSD